MFLKLQSIRACFVLFFSIRNQSSNKKCFIFCCCSKFVCYFIKWNNFSWEEKSLNKAYKVKWLFMSHFWPFLKQEHSFCEAARLAVFIGSEVRFTKLSLSKSVKTHCSYWKMLPVRYGGGEIWLPRKHLLDNVSPQTHFPWPNLKLIKTITTKSDLLFNCLEKFTSENVVRGRHGLRGGRGSMILWQ